MSNTTILFVIVLSSIITFLLRATPFILFGRGNKPPRIIEKLGELLPFAVIASLVVYCLKDIPTSGFSDNIKLVAAVLSVIIVHIWKKNTIASITVGTVLYMILLHI